MKIEVKRKHIQDGICGTATMCAVALAIKDAGFSDALVTSRIRADNIWYRLPRSAGRFIIKFDMAKTTAAKRKLKPFSFFLKEAI